MNEQPAQQRPQNCGTSYCSCIECVMEPAQQQEPVAWPCLIAEADFEKDTITLEMQCSDYKVKAGQHWLCTSPPAGKPLVGLTDEMVVAAARTLSDRHAAACNVDCGDVWKMYGNDFIEDARAALEAAHGIKGEQHG